MNKRSLKPLFLIVLGIGVILLAWIYLNNYLQRSKATGDAVTITFAPTTGSGAVGQSQSVNLLITAENGKKISGIDLKLQAQGNIKIVEVNTPVPLATGDTTFFNQIVKDVTDTQGRIAYTASKPEAQLPSAIKIPIVIQGTAEGTGSLTIDQAHTQIVGTAAGNSFTFSQVDGFQSTIGGQTTTSPAPTTSGPTPVLGAPITLKFTPSANTAGVGDTFNTTFQITNGPAGAKVSAFTALILFDPNLIEVTNVAEPDPKFTKLNKDIDNTQGEITLGYFSSLPAAQLPSEVAMQITAVGKAVGSGTLTIKPDVRVAGTVPENGFTPNIQNGNVTITQGTNVTPTTGVNCGGLAQQCCSALNPANSCFGGNVCNLISNTCVPAPTTGQGGNVTLNLKVKFQGITKKPNNPSPINVAVRLAGGQLTASTPYQTVQFTPSDDGFWGGTTNFDVPAGAGYRVYIKGPKHLAKKICDATPTETAPGTYRCSDGHLTLSNGSNTIDASGVILLAGDLPQQGSTGQNGVVDAFDVSFIRNNLGSTDPRVLQVGDLNLDGIVDSQDFSLVLESLSIKYDEE